MKSVLVLWAYSLIAVWTQGTKCLLNASLHLIACFSTQAALTLSSLSQLEYTVCLQEVRCSAGAPAGCHLSMLPDLPIRN